MARIARRMRAGRATLALLASAAACLSGTHHGPAWGAPGHRPSGAGRGGAQGRETACRAFPWDPLFGGSEPEPVRLPSSVDELNEELQSSMLSAIEAGLPRMDVELPPGLGLGIEGRPRRLRPAGEEPAAAEANRGDRELAAAFVLLFEGLKNDRSLCVAFRTEALAAAAKRAWRDWGKARIIALPNPKRAAFGGGNSVLSAARRPFLLAVAPSPEQLRELSEVEDADSPKSCIILLNARIRGLLRPDEIRERLAAASDAIFHYRFEGTSGLVYRAHGSPWVLARRRSEGSPGEISRSDDEPEAEALGALRGSQ